MENKEEKVISTSDEIKEKIDSLDDNNSYNEESLAENISDISADDTEKDSQSENTEEFNSLESEESLEEDKVESINNILKNSEILNKDDYALENFETEPDADNNYAGIAAESFIQAPVKKKIHLQIPIIISSCILIGAILGFLIFNLFFLHSPLGTWSITTEDDITYYYTFEKDNSLRMTIGSIDYVGKYALAEADGKKTVNIDQYYGAFSGQYEYSITGSKILGNQEFHLTNGDQEYTLTRAKIPNNVLTVSEDFKEDKNLTGEWVHVFEDYGGLTYKFIFNKDGTMQINQYDTYIYNCTYTCDGSNIECTFYSLEPVTENIEYSCDGKTLKIMGIECTRAGESTADQK